MFEIVPGSGWLLFAYIVGTLFGLWYKQKGTVEKTIDSLIDNGYLKHRKDAKGEIEILKYNED
jgi:DNA-binding MarR family transcriptional regulator